MSTVLHGASWTVGDMLGPMRALAAACERVAATTKKNEKVRHLADHLAGRPPEEAALAAVFLCGRPFPARDETTLDVGGALLWRAVEQVAAADQASLVASFRRHGDLGDAAGELLAAAGHAGRGDPGLSLPEVAKRLRAVAAARGPAAKLAAIAALLGDADALEAKYIVDIITSELRIGSKESLVEEAIAAAYEADVADVQRANMLLGDIGEVVRLAAAGRLSEARMRLFHAIAPMLASPAESAAEAFERFEDPLAEDKLDGIRAQVHAGGGRVRIFSRTLEDVTAAFPELEPELARFDGEVILDGEILAWRDGRALPFPELQKRLGRKRPTPALMRAVPVALVVFDVLYAGGELLLDRPLRDRKDVLARLFASRRAAAPSATARGQLALFAEASAPASPVLAAPVHRAATAGEIEALFAEARARGNEGLVIKDPASPYTPGRRGKAWLKLKRELATLDVVVTAVEYGYGKRAGVLSDYTFAVRDGERLVNIGKAYSGLTDAEIAENTRWFLDHTIHDHGRIREVEPTMVIEVAFNNMMRTTRHASGFALRFPRIVRLRSDKRPEDADTLETAREIFDLQGASEPAPDVEG
ncbi:MAG: ATP-dependent DNA ligase [Minicystis sp.]